MAVISKIQVGTNGSSYELGDVDARSWIDSYGFLPNNPYLHNAIPRGKNIQEYFDNGSLYTKISNGTFEDLFIGDYWKAKYNGVEKTFRIAGFNIYNIRTHTSDSYTLGNHAVIVPDEILGSCEMNQTNTTVGGYRGSYANKTVIGDPATSGGTSTVNQCLRSIFGNHLLTIKEYLYYSMTDSYNSAAGMGFRGVATISVITDCQAIPMSEVELYGSSIYGSRRGETGFYVTQLPLFRLMPQMKNPGNYNFWLRTISSTEGFCVCGRDGSPRYSIPTGEHDVRPRFVIG